MRKICVPIMAAIAILLLYPGQKAEAAVSRVTTSWTTTGGTFTVGTQSYTGVTANITAINEPDNDYFGQYQISQTIDISGFNSTKYYNGAFVVQIINSIGSGEGTVTPGEVVFEQQIDEGLHAYMYQYTAQQYRIAVIMDNYKPQSGYVSIGTVTSTWNVSSIDPNAPGLDRNITATISKTSGGTIESSDVVINNRFTALLFSAIQQATIQQFNDILNMLTNIRDQDYAYYAQITSTLSSLLDESETISTILNNLNLNVSSGFHDVQTILDMFPAYRQQIYEYWEELLLMNAAQSSEAADMESEYANKNDQSNNLLSALGNITYPSISAGDVDIMSNVDSDTKTNFFGMLSLITNNSLITTILLIVITGMIVGYILYGKR